MMRGSLHCKSYSYTDRSMLYIHVTRVCRTRSASCLSRPGAGYPRSEGSGAKFEVYLGIAAAARALRAELEDIQTQLRHHSLSVSVEFLAAYWRQDHRARAS